MRLLKLILVILILCVIMSGADGLYGQIPTSGLVAYYSCNGNGNDGSGRGHNARTVTAIPTSDRFAGLSAAYYFNGTNSTLLEIPDNSDFDMGSLYSISVWFKLRNFQSNRTLIKKNSTSRSYNDYISLMVPNNTGCLTARIGNGTAGSERTVSSGVINDTSWHHAVVGVSGSMTMWFDGILVGSTPVDIVPKQNSDPLDIGVWHNQSAPFYGALDDIRIYNRALTSTEIHALYQEGGWGSSSMNLGEYSPDGSTALLLHMNEISGSTVFDASSFGNNGTITGTTIGAGRFGNARSFNGVSDWIRVADAPSLNPSTALTVETWIKTSSSHYNAGVLGKWNATGGQYDRQYAFQVTNQPSDLLQFGIYTTTQVNVIDQSGYNDGKWHHYAGVWDGSYLCLYKDGVLKAKAACTGTIPSINQNLEIGRYAAAQQGSNNYFNGLIDEVRISNEARSPQEFNLQLPPTNLVAGAVGTQVSLNWQNGGGAVGLLRYEIYRGTDSTNVTLIDSTTSTSYTNSGLAAGITYFYRVSAVDVTGFEGAQGYAARAQTLFAGEYQADANTVLMLHMNETSGSTASDASNSGSNGTAIGANIVTGRFGNARSFNGAGAWVDLGVTQLCGNSNEITVECWSQSASPPPVGAALVERSDDGYPPAATRIFRLHISPIGEIGFGVNNIPPSNGVGVMSAAGVYSFDNQWQHIVATYSSSAGTKIYRNGVKIAESALTAGSISNIALRTNVGSKYNSIPAQWFNGTIDEVRISNKVRSPQEFNLQLPPTNLAASPTGTSINLSQVDRCEKPQ